MGIGLTIGFFLYLGQYYTFGYLEDEQDIQLLIWMIVIDFYIIRVIY